MVDRIATRASPPGSRPEWNTWSKVVALLACTAFSLLVVWSFHDHGWFAPDDASYAELAERVISGEVLNRDVQDLHTGGVTFVNAWALRLFGQRLVSMRYPLALITVLQACLMFFLYVNVAIFIIQRCLSWFFIQLSTSV